MWAGCVFANERESALTLQFYLMMGAYCSRGMWRANQVESVRGFENDDSDYMLLLQ